ncbi:MAG: flagellar biosynthetic protein FliR [Candidatus Hydrogenedentes bacterium]|nr:flagellar biosynthetic protein FliR [Candidatus Hydrogenedentota bacterium]MBI3117156.1 flagellar biosynthetic protein FliR [Candidatus Hydrogenedentota bacterium]
MFELDVFRLFLLVLARFSGLMIAAPVLGSANIPAMAKAGAAGLMALLVTPVLPPLSEPVSAIPLQFAVMAAGELMVGLIIGFVMALTFAAIQLGGQIMDMQTGFGMMNVFNPALEIQFPIFGFFLFIIAVLYLLVINGHHMMIQALVASYEHVPVGQFGLKPAVLFEVSRWGTQIFFDGLRIAAPVAGAMLLAYITMGFLGRVVPQIHLFVIGFPLTMAGGLLLTALIIGVYLQLLDDMFYQMFKNVDMLLHGMGNA